MWCLEALPLLEAASRRNSHCLGLGLGLDLAASVLLLPRGTNLRETNFSPKQCRDFYPRDAMLARVFARATCLSVCPSVRHEPVLYQNEES